MKNKHKKLPVILIAALTLSIGYANAQELTSKYDKTISIDTNGNIGTSVLYIDNNSTVLATGAPFSYKNNIQTGSVSILDTNNPNKVVNIYGDNNLDRFGSSIEKCDIDNDGYNELIVGAYNSKNKNNSSGKVYIFDVENILDSKTEIYSSEAKTIIYGNSNDRNFGISLGCGDINNDGISDLLIGSPNANKSKGAVHIYAGSKNTISYLSSIYGKIANERFGSKIVVANIDNNKSKDIIIGAYFANNLDKLKSGKVYIYNDYSLDYSDDNPIVLNGLASAEWFGFSIASKDVNNDGFNDILVGSFSYANNDACGITIFKSSKSGELTKEKKIVNICPSQINVSDLDSDGKNEIIVGAPINGSDEYSNEGKLSILSDSGENNVFGLNNNDWFGYSFDIQNNTIAIGARYANTKNDVNGGTVNIYNFFKNTKKPKQKNIIEQKKYLSRAEAVNIIINKLNIYEEKNNIINQCDKSIDYCLFNFTASSSYKDLSLKNPLKIYPDVQPGYKFYKAIITATKLGFINGYFNVTESPFMPDRKITRVQALKIALEASGLVKNKYKFEIAKSNINQYQDTNPLLTGELWYTPYSMFSYENSLIEDNDFFRPNDFITKDELSAIMKKILEIKESK